LALLDKQQALDPRWCETRTPRCRRKGSRVAPQSDESIWRKSVGLSSANLGLPPRRISAVFVEDINVIAGA